MRRATIVVGVAVATVMWIDSAFAGVATMTPSKDNTLYESATGALSNGAGQFLFVGRTNQKNGIRRALIAFDVASTLPAGAKIRSAQLTLTMSQTIAGPESVALHRVSADWGEGTSDAQIMGGGGGTAATTGDATWLHRFFSTDLWTNVGGDFVASVSASISISGNGDYTWGSTPAMVADVQGWLDDPTSNFGWLLQGDEQSAGTAKRFNTRENTDATSVPELTIEFDPPRPAAPALSSLSLLVLAALLTLIAARHLRLT
jgi:hypothetical protein